MTIGVIISTYNNPCWLEKALCGYACQTRQPDEVIVADDGSDDKTRSLIQRFSQQLPIKHVWHEDDGFRKTVILNKAIQLAESDYLIFTDHDCIPRNDFVVMHERMACKGCMLSGGYLKLTMAVSEAITCDDIQSQKTFRLSWLLRKGQPFSFKCTKLIKSKWYARLMNAITPTRASWNGMNSSGWREDIVAVNGFDERMCYGGLDRELGERLTNLGIKGRQIRYSAITLHLDHKRPYMSKETWTRNNNIRSETRRKHVTATPYGIKKLAED